MLGSRTASILACVRLEADQGPQAIAEAGAEEINRAFRFLVEVDGTQRGTQLQAEPWVLAFRTSKAVSNAFRDAFETEERFRPFSPNMRLDFSQTTTGRTKAR